MPYVGSAAVIDRSGDGVPRGERRAGRRLPLHCRLDILKAEPDGRDLSTMTENISSRGFCFVVDELMTPGDRLGCILRFPRRLDPRASQALRCAAHVVWVRSLDDGRFGIGCCIDDYTVVA
ncbi:MAG TPA: PilZ domain-containing protein [Bryobacteraceae bacterium]|nr:PilZ domain-containing protein [Bryobacteraceae bacterium]